MESAKLSKHRGFLLFNTKEKVTFPPWDGISFWEGLKQGKNSTSPYFRII